MLISILIFDIDISNFSININLNIDSNLNIDINISIIGSQMQHYFFFGALLCFWSPQPLENMLIFKFENLVS